MKNRFIQMFLVICAVMLIICTVSVWAAAEDVTATPTDLAPVGQEGSVPETTEPDTVDEEAADSMEIIITKTVSIGDSWSGTMKKTKPAVLKLDIDKARQVNVIVTGKDIWVTAEKSDRVTENPARTLTDEQTKQAVISWYAETGSYLITVGPVEPNLLGKANVSIMDNADYECWLANQEEEQEETTEETVDKVTEESMESDEKTEVETESENEQAEDFENEAAEENIPKSEEKSERHITVDITWDVPDPIIGDTAHFKATLEGYDDVPYSTQWQYSPDKITWYDLSGETDLTMDVEINEENNIVYWRILVFVEDQGA